MDRLTELASRLYPRWWRERYGDEFAALLEDAKPGLRGTFDILKGALTMRLSAKTPLKAVLVFAAAGVLCGIATTYFLKPQYASYATLSVTGSEGATGIDFGNTVNRYSQAVLSRTTLTEIIMKLDLYPAERRKMKAADVLETMKKDIRITAATAAVGGRTVPAFQIAFQYSDRVAAAKVVDTLVTGYLDTSRSPGTENRSVLMEVLDPASEPTDPVFPLRKDFAVAGLGTGLLLGSFAALILRLRRKRQPA